MFIDPVAFQIGPISVHWYGIIIAAAVLAGGVIGTFEARRRGEDPERGWNMLMLVIVTSVIAARAYHVIHEWSYYSQHLDLIPQVWRGGIGIPGAIAGGAFGIWLYTRRAHLNTARWLDIFAPALLLGQAIGRLGNYVNQELYGPPLQQCGSGHFLPCFQFGIPIDAAHRIDTPWTNLALFPVDTTRFVPMFAYEAILNLIGMVVLLYVARRFARRLYDGDVALMYIVWYGAVRSLLEGYRVNNWYIGPLPTAVWIGVAGVILAGGYLILRHVRGTGRPGAWMDRSDLTDEPDPPPQHATEPSPG
jgi:phosphatidylglycerol:prolipoprotein diacylglycerol transferase